LPQLDAVPVPHAPAPSQVAAVVALPPLQRAAVQTVVTPGSVHAVALAPLQLPWHGPAPAQATRLPCGAPLGTVVHVPTLPTTSHAWH
jgi:hypothetical protein